VAQGDDFFIFVGVSRICSSYSTHGVFSPTLVGGRLGWVVLCGLCPVVSVLARFPLINRAILFILINKKDKAFASFKKNPIQPMRLYI
jgi:hypothetical protein